MLADRHEPITRKSLTGLPIGLDGIYLEYLQRLLGKRGEDWNSEYGRILGVLTACQAPLTSLRRRISGRRNVRVTRWLWIGFFLH